MSKEIDVIEIYTDGACRGNPGVGGWAALLRFQQHEKLVSGAEALTTNNRMELLGAINGLRALKRASRVCISTDSQYVQRGITEWLPVWKRNQWRTASKAPVKNQDLWELLDTLVQCHQVQWQWVRGHSGHPENERVDAAARAAIDMFIEQQ